MLYPVAMESALKFKEGTYRHGESLSAGFFKHGTIALVESGFHAIALIPSDVDSSRYSATLATANENRNKGRYCHRLGHTTPSRPGRRMLRWLCPPSNS